MIVDMNVSRRMDTSLILNALEMPIWQKNPDSGLTHHNDAGVQYLSVAYSERFAEAGIAASVGSVADTYNNALAETINVLYKIEVIHNSEPWKVLIMLSTQYLTGFIGTTMTYYLALLGYVTSRELEEKYWKMSPHQQLRTHESSLRRTRGDSNRITTIVRSLHIVLLC